MSPVSPADMKVLLVMNPLPLHSGVGEVQLTKALHLLAGSCKRPVVVTANASPSAFPNAVVLTYDHDARKANLLGKAWKQLRSQLKMVMFCRAAIKQHGPFDAILFWVGAEQILAQFYLRLRRQNTIVYLYGTPKDIPGSGFLSRCLSGVRSNMRFWTTKLATQVAIEAPGIDLPNGVEGKTVVIPLGINKPSTQEQLIREGIVLYAGRLAECKGLEELLEATRSPSWPAGLELVIAGDGPLRDSIEAAAADQGNVRLLGWVGSDALQDWMQRCRYIILPSETEGLPNALMEGMANGAIPIATAVGGIPHLLEDFRLGQKIEAVSSVAILDAIAAVSKRRDLEEHSTACRSSILRRYALEVSQETLRKHLSLSRHGRTLILSNLLPGLSEGQSNIAKHLETCLRVHAVPTTHRNLKSALINPFFVLGLRRFQRIHLVFRYNKKLARLLRLLDLLVPARVTLWALQPPLQKPRRHAAVDSILCLSEMTAKMFHETGVVPRLIRCGVDLNRFGKDVAKSNARKDFGIDEKDHWVIHVGPIRENRGIRHLTEIASLPGVCVTIISRPGSGEDSGLRQFLESAGIQVFIDHLDSIEDLYRSADLMVFPTTDPSGCIEIPLSVIEALACGLPVVSLPFGGLIDHFPQGGIGLRIVADAGDLREAVSSALACNEKPNMNLSAFDWKQSLPEALAAIPTGRRRGGKLVVVTGLDGAGKSTLLASLATELRGCGYRVVVPWGGYEMKLFRPLVKLAKRLAGASPERMESDYRGYRKAMVGAVNRPFVGPIYRMLVGFEYALQMFWKVRLPLWRGQVVLSDRFVHDLCVAFAANGDESDELLIRRARRWSYLVPKPQLKLFLDVAPEVSMDRKDDIPDLEYLTSRRQRYLTMTSATGFQALDGAQPPEKVLAQAWSLTSSLLDSSTPCSSATEGAAGNRA